MTILPAIRKTGGNAEENKESNQQNGPSERVNRRNDINSKQIASLSENNATARRSPFPFKNDRKERLRKRYKESDRPRDRENVREQKREARREQKRDRIVLNKREIIAEPLHENNTITSPVDNPTTETPCSNSEVVSKEDCTGFNSEDEYDESVIKDRHLTDEEWQKRDAIFARCMSNLGFEIKNMNEDGACLFRSIADQVYGDQEFHFQVRQDCMNYIVQNRDYFEPYVTEDFDKYVARKRTWHVHGNHLEIQAMSELYNRTIEVYCYQIEPINIFNCSRLINSYEPIRLSYHRMCHYNSISNPNKPSVGVGLGLPNYKPIDIDRRRFNDAIRASEELLIEQTMLEDKIKATDWEATNEAIEEQVARESYIQYFRDAEKRLKAQGHPLASGSSSTITSSMISSPRASRRGSVSPKGCQSPASPKNSFSPLASPRTSFGSNSSNNTLTFTPDCANVENVPVPYVPTSEEEAFAKRVYNSPRRIAEPEINFSGENFSAEFNEQAGPSGSNGIGLEDFDQEIMARVLAESQKTYLDELKHKSKKRNGSPGPSTSS
ncbi:OTU domain-containing protein 5-B isoform X1 [Anoplophora glabripennis]|nr:OTU domain-containing protein 5-B isoform X1 [Anoplophora glabripennis]